MGAEKFVPQITMAMFNVHKIEAELVRHASGAMKLLNDFFDFRIGEQWIVRRQIQPAVQNRVTVQNARLGTPFLVRTAVTARMRQLQSNQRPSSDPETWRCSAMSAAFNIAKPACVCEAANKLIRIGAPFVTDGDRFAAPDQFCSTPPESLPSAQCMFAGIAIGRSVPAFHGINREAIANSNSFANDWLRQRRLWLRE